MKTSFIASILPKSVLVRKIDKRHAKMAQNVLLKEGINPADLEFIKKNQARLGRFAKKQGVKVEFEPIKNDLFSTVRMNVYKDSMGVETRMVSKGSIKSAANSAKTKFVEVIKCFITPG